VGSQAELGNQNSNRNAVLEQIREALAGLKFGVVTVIVQDGVVVQLERTEKHRLRGLK
jgi:hypothetical protein